MIGIITAMDKELEAIKEVMKITKTYQRGGSVFYLGYIGKQSIVLGQSGIGKVNAAIATTLMIESGNIDLVINSGIAGGLLPLKTEDIVIAKHLYYSDVDAVNFGYKPGQIPGMPHKFSTDKKFRSQFINILTDKGYDYVECDIYTADKFVSDGVKLEDYVPKENIAMEMEGTSIAQTCFRFKVPFVSVRYISDVIGSNNQLENYARFEAEMAKKSANLCIALIESL